MEPLDASKLGHSAGSLIILNKSCITVGMTEDLREEERTIIYRKLIGELTKVGIDNEQVCPLPPN